MHNIFHVGEFMYIEKRSSGTYYKCTFSVIDYEKSTAAVRMLSWYVSHLNRQLDNSRYTFFLTHTECVLELNIKNGEWKNINLRNCILARADKIIRSVKKDMKMLSKGTIPEKIKTVFTEEVESIRLEW